MTESLKDNTEWVIMALQFQFGWALGITTWRAILAFSYGICSTFMEQWMTSLLPEDKTWVNGLLNHRFYRLASAAIRVATSIKLPSTDALVALKTKRLSTGDTTTITKPPTL